MDPTNLIVFIIVVGLRLFIPLLIPRFPLPAIIACLIIDGIDQTIFQQYTTINLDGYQGYDKALDIYYLAIAYLSTFRNWTNPMAFRISQFLFYYRVIGDTLFEFTHIRAILFIFPNTFEYFFIFISFIALFYNMKRLSTKFLVGSAAFIWIFIKLPQEYWLHIAQLDMTDFLKEKIFHVPLDATGSEILAANSWIIPALIIFTIVSGIIIWLVAKRLPKPDHKFTFSPKIEIKLPSVSMPKRYLDILELYKYDLIEKMIFVGLISVIFAHIFTSFQASWFQLILAIVFVILVNATFGYLLTTYSRFKSEHLNKFFFMYLVNLTAAFVFAYTIKGDNELNYFLILFFAYLLTLITVYYDRFKPYYIARFGKAF